jgi:hypothetical protein
MQESGLELHRKVVEAQSVDSAEVDLPQGADLDRSETVRSGDGSGGLGRALERAGVDGLEGQVRKLIRKSEGLAPVPGLRMTT